MMPPIDNRNAAALAARGSVPKYPHQESTTVFNAEELAGHLKEEINQRREEGCRVDGFEARLAAAGKDLAGLGKLYGKLDALKPDAKLAREEPSDLRSIRAKRPKGPRKMKSRSPAVMKDRIRGALLGRCAGCTLGKPVEGWTAERIATALKKDKTWPLADYFTESAVKKGKTAYSPKMCTRGNFALMERDDDIDYSILGIHYIRTYGAGFTTRNVADEWLQRLPYHMVYTAERAAYRNLVDGVPLEQVPTYRNPYREWIGAQIRADGFGYCAAGMPELAAEFAHRDASVSHVKNGIYGEMLFAAMIAAAAVSDDLDEAIEVGLSEIPVKSRLALAMRQVIAWSRSNADWLDTLAMIQKEYGAYNWVHTINNAALVVMALVHGKGDYSRTISMAVAGGWDTDCNGATAGSVLGALLGEKKVPARWLRPLKNKLRSFVVGYDNSKITDIADMALAENRKILKK